MGFLVCSLARYRALKAKLQAAEAEHQLLEAKHTAIHQQLLAEAAQLSAEQLQAAQQHLSEAQSQLQAAALDKSALAEQLSHMTTSRDKLSADSTVLTNRITALKSDAKSYELTAQQAAAAQQARFEAQSRLADVETTAWVALEGRSALQAQLDDLRCDMALLLQQEQQHTLEQGMYLEALMDEKLEDEDAHQHDMLVLQERLRKTLRELVSAQGATAELRTTYKTQLTSLKVQMNAVLTAAKTDRQQAHQVQQQLEHQLCEARVAAKAARGEAAALQAKSAAQAASLAALQKEKAAAAAAAAAAEVSRLSQHSMDSVTPAGQAKKLQVVVPEPDESSSPPTSAKPKPVLLVKRLSLSTPLRSSVPSSPSSSTPKGPSKPLSLSTSLSAHRPKDLKISRIPSRIPSVFDAVSLPGTPGATARLAAHPIVTQSWDRFSDASMLSSF